MRGSDVAGLLVVLGSHATTLAAVPPPSVAELDAPQGEGLVVVEERVRVECAATRECRFETTYVIECRSQAPVETPMRGPYMSRRVRLDGEELPHESGGITVRFEPSQRRTLVFEGSVGAVMFTSFVPIFDGLFARHVLLSTPWQVAHASFAIDPPSAPLLDEARLEVDLSAPGDWSLTAGPEWSDHVEGDRRVARFVAREARDGTWASLRAERFVLEPRFGGVFAGIGGTFDQNRRMRLGLEVGFGELLTTSIAMETDFETHFTLAWVAGAALPAALVIPSLDAALGVAVRVWDRARDSARAGLRIQLGAMFYALGLVATFDYWPIDGLWDSSLLFQVSL